MIQRIQSLYLLIVSGLLFSMFFSNMMVTSSGSISYVSSAAFAILITVTFVLAFVSIFLYRHRIVQMRLVMIDAIVLLAFQIWIGYWFFTKPDGTAFSITAVFPLVCVILCVLAYIGIARDEALVQSVSRIRDTNRKKKK